MDIIHDMLTEEVQGFAGLWGKMLYQTEVCKTPAYFTKQGDWYLPTISTYHHLRETLTHDAVIQKDFNDYVQGKLLHNYTIAWGKVIDENWLKTILEEYLQERGLVKTYEEDTRLEDTFFDRPFVASTYEHADADDDIVVVQTLNGYLPEFGLSQPRFFRPRYVRRMREHGADIELFDFNRFSIACTSCELFFEHDGDFSDNEFVNYETDEKWDGTLNCPKCGQQLESWY